MYLSSQSTSTSFSNSNKSKVHQQCLGIVSCITMEFKCKRCNPDHDYKTARKLRIHENTPSHKRKLIVQRIAMEFRCNRCNPDHDYKTELKLRIHEKTPSHKRKFDPEFAAADEIEKVAAKKSTK